MRLAWILLLAGGCKETPPVPAPESQAAVPVAQASAEPAAASSRAAVPAAPAKLVSLRVHRTALGGARASEKLPWVVGFHGLGDTPEGFSKLLTPASAKAHAYFPQAPNRYGEGFDWFRARVRGPEAKLTVGIEAATSAALSLLEELMRQPQNQGKPIVFGFSQGGIMSFALAARAPNRLKASLPLSGWLPPSLWPAPAQNQRASRRPPIIAFHGEADRVVPFGPTQKSVSALQERGFDATLKGYPSLKHQLNSHMFQDFLSALEAQLARGAAPE